MLALTALLSLATYVFADETFSLTAKGDGINSKVGIDGSKLALNNQAATFILQTPSGYLTANGQDVVLTPNGIELGSEANHSKDFGVEDGKLRSGPSSDKFDFYSCPDGTLANFQCLGGVAITLYTGDVTETASSAEPSSSSASSTQQTTSASSKVSSSTSEVHSTTSETSSSAPETWSSTSVAPSSSVTEAPVANGTVTDLHSTLVTITTCLDHACTKSSANVSTFEAGAGQAKYAAGAIAIAGALLL